MFEDSVFLGNKLLVLRVCSDFVKCFVVLYFPYESTERIRFPNSSSHHIND